MDGLAASLLLLLLFGLSGIHSFPYSQHTVSSRRRDPKSWDPERTKDPTIVEGYYQHPKMQLTSTILSTIAALASTAAAQVPNMAIDLRFPIPTEPPQHLVQRDLLRMYNTETTPVESLLQCASTLRSVVSVMPTPPPSLQSWALHGARREQVTKPCSLTMPVSLSSDYVDYSSKAFSWVLAVSSVVDQVKAKCTEVSGEIPVAFAIPCPSQPTVFWVEADGKTTRAEEQTLPTQLVPGVTSTPQSVPTGRGAATSTTGTGSAAATGSGTAVTTGQTSAVTTGATSAASALRSAGLGMIIGAVACAVLV